MKPLGIPYMGSKRAISRDLVNHILSENKDTKYVYDLFGGGGAMSFAFLQRDMTVTYNEIDTSIVSLLRDIKDNGVTEKYYKWIGRDEFFELIKGTDWMSGLAKTVWSFGNNGKDYIYGRHIELYKNRVWNYIVNGDNDSLIALCKTMGIDNPQTNGLLFSTIRARGKVFRSIIRNINPKESLESLQRLQSLQSLQRLESLEIKNISYDEVSITSPKDKTIIYLDPPYKGTGKYSNEIDYNKLSNFIKKSKYKIYVSGYNNDYGLEESFKIKKRNIFSPTSNTESVEYLYTN